LRRSAWDQKYSAYMSVPVCLRVATEAAVGARSAPASRTSVLLAWRSTQKPRPLSTRALKRAACSRAQTGARIGAPSTKDWQTSGSMLWRSILAPRPPCTQGPGMVCLRALTGEAPGRPLTPAWQTSALLSWPLIRKPPPRFTLALGGAASSPTLPDLTCEPRQAHTSPDHPQSPVLSPAFPVHRMAVYGWRLKR